MFFEMLLSICSGVEDVEVDGVEDVEMVELFVDDFNSNCSSSGNKSSSSGRSSVTINVIKGFFSTIGKKSDGKKEVNNDFLEADNVQEERLEILDDSSVSTPRVRNASLDTTVDDTISELSESTSHITQEANELVESVKQSDLKNPPSPEKEDILTNLVSFIRSNSIKLKRSLSKDTVESLSFITLTAKEGEDDKTPEGGGDFFFQIKKTFFF